ncbi:hypothetical protein Mapa_004876 [Marchantia paleacea]|nr:hypothetical protein Mapa_004876 [Marchantia paleacea]
MRKLGSSGAAWRRGDPFGLRTEARFGPGRVFLVFYGGMMSNSERLCGPAVIWVGGNAVVRDVKSLVVSSSSSLKTAIYVPKRIRCYLACPTYMSGITLALVFNWSTSSLLLASAMQAT